MNVEVKVNDQSIDTVEYITVHVGDMLLGVDIAAVDEIIRYVEPTFVPHAPPIVRGVLNLRGEVITVLDFAMMLGLPAAETSRQSRIVITRSQGERIGLCVDRVGDVVNITSDDLDATPCNIDASHVPFVRGACQLPEGIIAILDIESLLEKDYSAGPVIA